MRKHLCRDVMADYIHNPSELGQKRYVTSLTELFSMWRETCECVSRKTQSLFPECCMSLSQLRPHERRIQIEDWQYSFLPQTSKQQLIITDGRNKEE